MRALLSSVVTPVTFQLCSVEAVSDGDVAEWMKKVGWTLQWMYHEEDRFARALGAAATVELLNGTVESRCRFGASEMGVWEGSVRMKGPGALVVYLFLLFPPCVPELGGQPLTKEQFILLLNAWRGRLEAETGVGIMSVEKILTPLHSLVVRHGMTLGLLFILLIPLLRCCLFAQAKNSIYARWWMRSRIRAERNRFELVARMRRKDADIRHYKAELNLLAARAVTQRQTPPPSKALPTTPPNPTPPLQLALLDDATCFPSTSSATTPPPQILELRYPSPKLRTRNQRRKVSRGGRARPARRRLGVYSPHPLVSFVKLASTRRPSNSEPTSTRQF